MTNATLKDTASMLEGQASECIRGQYLQWLMGVQAETGEPDLSKLDTPDRQQQFGLPPITVPLLKSLLESI